MPKARPTQVITHRIEFQDKERELLEGLAYTNMVSKAVPAVMAGVGIGLAGYGLYYFFKEVYDITGDIISDVKDIGTSVVDAVNPTKPETSVIGAIINPSESPLAGGQEGGTFNKECDWWDVACQLENTLLYKMATNPLGS